MPAELRTERLLLRRWHDADREPFAALNADSEVMRWFPAPGAIARATSDAFADRIASTFDEQGWGLWAVELVAPAPPRRPRPFIGFVGLSVPRFGAPFMPAVEVGWRLARDVWGHGYATEGGRAALAFGFGELGLEEIVSFTTAGNRPSRRVMERLGMRRDPAGDFEHPSLAADDPIRPHVLYRVTAADGSGEAPFVVPPPGAAIVGTRSTSA